ncbi:Hypothetical predicted protein [Olea europaea subsp. europaea]|uniref:Myb/SANT-like domain-containing protein n=1 Tax=Olea europaea subsp. europaea TaxID=158383 RepID=A0A8S0UJ75_OLEEU|nr:Hypothetical predicted protein [Olea europaea subsp. europaea]
MDDEGSHWGQFPDNMSYNTTWVEPLPAVTPSRRSDRRTDGRKCAKWDPQEHRIFISVVEYVTAKGHRRGKCFTTAGWERIREFFNKRAGKDWTVTQLKNHWGVMRTDHKLLMELLRCTGIHYGLNSGGRIEADDWWWEQKIKENPKYSKFRYNDNSEIFHTYGKLFGATQDSTKYALTSTKLSQHGLDVSSDCDAQADFNDMLPINAETTDSSDGPAKGRLTSTMDISVGRSGEKRKGKPAKGRGKKKKFGAREVSESVDNLASASREFASALRSRDKGVMTIADYVNDLLTTELVQSGDELHLFALWFFRDVTNRVAYAAAETPELRFAWMQYCFERDKKSKEATSSRARRRL